MFKNVKVTGSGAAIVWGYRTAAALRKWTVAKDSSSGKAVWTLTATVERSSAWELRQVPLLLTVPRKGGAGGFMVWPLIGPPRIIANSLSATLGPPEH